MFCDLPIRNLVFSYNTAKVPKVIIANYSTSCHLIPVKISHGGVKTSNSQKVRVFLLQTIAATQKIIADFFKSFSAMGKKKGHICAQL